MPRNYEMLTFEDQLDNFSSGCSQRSTFHHFVGQAQHAIAHLLKYTCKALLKRRQARRSLSLLEIQQLGDKRFVAVIRVGRQKFLVGGAQGSVSLLAELDSQRTKIGAPHPLAQETA